MPVESQLELANHSVSWRRWLHQTVPIFGSKIPTVLIFLYSVSLFFTEFLCTILPTNLIIMAVFIEFLKKSRILTKNPAVSEIMSHFWVGRYVIP